jgi:RNA polymerase sigma factor (sigma-70 family)
VREKEERNTLIEKNMGLVGKVIKDKIHNVHRLGIYSYDDLFQIGCVGLCIAADIYRQSDNGRFSTYAYIIIRNEIFGVLKRATLKNRREIMMDFDYANIGDVNDTIDISAEIIINTLKTARLHSNGVTAKGIDAIHLLAEGYTHREIGERMGGVSANNVSAWVAKARKYLRSEESVADLRDAV